MILLRGGLPTAAVTILRYNCLKPKRQEVPVFAATYRRVRRYPAPGKQREDNAQVENPYGREKALQKDWHRQITRGQTKTRHILSSKSPKVKRKLGKKVLVSDGDYKKVARMIPYA